jgi:hypothetical protein
MTKLIYGQSTIGMRLEGVVEVHYGVDATRETATGATKIDKWIKEAVLTRCVPGTSLTIHRCFHPEAESVGHRVQCPHEVVECLNCGARVVRCDCDSLKRRSRKAVMKCEECR